MTTRAIRKRTLRLLATALAVLIASWLVMQAGQWLFRARAEALLEDIKSLELNRSRWSEAQTLMKRWGKWGHWYGSCDAELCDYSIRIDHLALVHPSFVFEEGPHISARLLQLVGLRSAVVTARFRVAHGIVSSKGFGLDVPLPVNQWLSPEGPFWQRQQIGHTYWPSLDVAFIEDTKPQSTPDQIGRHPYRGFIQRRIRLEATFTREESPEEQAALTAFRFDCITRWTPCTTRAEILPRAEQEFEAEMQR